MPVTMLSIPGGTGSSLNQAWMEKLDTVCSLCTLLKIVVPRRSRSKVHPLEVLEPERKNVFVRLDRKATACRLILEIEPHHPDAGRRPCEPS